MTGLRSTQDHLLDLEQRGAPVEDQIHQAALFAGLAPIRLHLPNEGNEVTTGLRRSGGLHGRQEYILRWLLKKLQVQEMRRYPDAWCLFTLLASRVPIRNVARILSEKSLIVLLGQTVEEAAKRRLESPSGVAEKIEDESSDTARLSHTRHGAHGTISTKRNRDGEPTEGARRDDGVNDDLIQAVYDSMRSLLRFTEPGPSPADTFASEHFRSAIRTTGEEAARLLGRWFKWCQSSDTVWRMNFGYDVLSPFVEIWNLRATSDEDHEHFARQCLLPSLGVLCTDGLLSKPKAQVERLLAQQVIVPMRSAFASSMTSSATLPGGSMSEAVSEEPLFAPILFDVAIRSLQPRNPRPRRLEDSAWLRWVFSTLHESMMGSSSESRVTAMIQMLQISVRHKVVLDVPFLQLVTAEYGLSANDTSWNVIAAIIALDPNVFLVPQAPNDLSKKLLMRITNACMEPSWPAVADQVVGSVLVPLMDAFATARQLGVFIRLWYEQLVAFESLRQNEPMRFAFYCAWEDEALQDKLSDLLEASFTDQQIVETLGWLQERIIEGEAAVLVLIEVIAGALSHVDTMAVVGPKLPQLSTDVFNLDLRYRPRVWRLARASLHWPTMKGMKRSEMDPHLSDRLGELLTNLISSDSFLNLEVLESCRYLCALWSSGSSPSREAATAALKDQISGVATLVGKLARDIKTGQASGQSRWGSKILSLGRDLGWFACAYIYCVLREHPKVLELFPKVRDLAGSSLLMDIIWIASATTASTADHSPSTWLKVNHDALPGIWTAMLQDEYILNDPNISRQIIQAMLDCQNHQDNPIVKSSACNGFVIRSLHQLPLEVFSKADRVAIVKAWQPELQDPPSHEAVVLSYCMAPLDPAVLGLKVKMMQRSTLYDGITFEQFVDLAHHIVSKGHEPQVLTPIFGKLVQMTLSQVMDSIDQPKRQEYFRGMMTALNEWLEKNLKPKKPPSYAMTRLMQEVMVALSNRSALLESSGILSKEESSKLRRSFVGVLLLNLRQRFDKPEKLKGKRCLSLSSAMDALDVIMDVEITQPLLDRDPRAVLMSLKQSNLPLGQRLETFMIQHYPNSLGGTYESLLGGDVSSTRGREAIQQTSKSVALRLEGCERLHLAIALMKEAVAPHVLDRLLSLRHIIATCEDLRPTKGEDDAGTSSLSSVFTLLAARLRNSKGVREFCLVSETMEMMLRTKPHSITQYNIDNTLSTITMLCTRRAPSFRPSRCGTIYSYLVRLVHTILTCHRLKIQGHLHLVVQTLISLLRCLFTISTSGSHKSSHAGSAPPLPRWLSPLASGRDDKAHQLTAQHSQSYSRLLTLLCDPTPSSTSTSRSSQPSLHSTTKLAKHNAGLHIGHVLTAYIRWTLDMSLSMQRDVREALVPGWWAVLEAMGQVGRRLVGEQMDASGRVVLTGLVRDWRRFGKWKG